MLPLTRAVVDSVFFDFLGDATGIIFYLRNVVAHCIEHDLFKDASP